MKPPCVEVAIWTSPRVIAMAPASTRTALRREGDLAEGECGPGIDLYLHLVPPSVVLRHARATVVQDRRARSSRLIQAEASTRRRGNAGRRTARRPPPAGWTVSRGSGVPGCQGINVSMATVSLRGRRREAALDALLHPRQQDVVAERLPALLGLRGAPRSSNRPRKGRPRGRSAPRAAGHDSGARRRSKPRTAPWCRQGSDA